MTVENQYIYDDILIIVIKYLHFSILRQSPALAELQLLNPETYSMDIEFRAKSVHIHKRVCSECPLRDGLKNEVGLILARCSSLYQSNEPTISLERTLDKNGVGIMSSLIEINATCLNGD